MISRRHRPLQAKAKNSRSSIENFELNTNLDKINILQTLQLHIAGEHVKFIAKNFTITNGIKHWTLHSNIEKCFLHLRKNEM